LAFFFLQNKLEQSWYLVVTTKDRSCNQNRTQSKPIMKRRTFLSTLTVAGIATTFRPTLGSTKQRSTKLDLPGLLAVTEVPAILISGIIRGRPVQHVAGVRSVSDRIPIASDTYFPAASLSKPVFAWAVRDLVRQRKLEWTRPLQDYADLGLNGEARRITAEHVLTHSTGLPNWRFQLDKPLATEFTPGSRWQYSGEGIFLLQRVVEKIVGVPIATYMKRSVLQPLGMTASTFAWSPEVQAKATSGHDRRANLLERSSVFYAQRSYDVIRKADLDPESATYEQIVAAYEKAKAQPLPVAMSPNMAGSLWTTAVDYPKFLKAVMSDIPLHADDYRARVRVNPKIAWSLGWGVDESLLGRGVYESLLGRGVYESLRRPARGRFDARRDCYFHWGDGPGFKNFAWVQPDTQTALVFFTNGDHGLSAYSWAFRTLLAEDPASLAWL
jgi:CubicO group peptidase (beta-lactamase class C family)